MVMYLTFGRAARSCARCSLMLLLVVLFTGSAVGQSKYREHKINEKYKKRQELSKLQKEKQKVLKGNPPFTAGKGTLDEYYKKFFFLAMTMEEFRGKLAEMRVKLQSDLRLAGSGPAYEYVRDLAFSFCRQLAAKKEYHPAVRYNAMLIVGILNQSEADMRAGRPAVPYAKSLRTLIGGLKDPEDAVRTAALIGLKRHAELSDQPGAPAPMNDKFRRGITMQLLPVIAEVTPPSGRDDEAHDWMRRIAVQALGYLRPPPDQEVLTTLIDVMKDKSADKTLRCQCAETLGCLELAEADVPAEALTRVVALVAADCCRSEIMELRELAGPGQRRRGVDSRSDRPRFDASRGEEDDPRQRAPTVQDVQTMPSRRRLLERLALLHRGLAGDTRSGIKGIAAMSDGASKNMISMVKTRISDMIHAIQKTEDPLITYGSRLRVALRDLQPLIGDLEELAPRKQESMPAEQNVAADT